MYSVIAGSAQRINASQMSAREEQQNLMDYAVRLDIALWGEVSKSTLKLAKEQNLIINEPTREERAKFFK